MQKPQKDLLRSLVSDLRHLLLGKWNEHEAYTPGDLDRELERLGFGRDGSITAIDALPNPTAHDLRAYRLAEAQLAQLPPKARIAARSEIIERAAYSWINRLLALRAMEARGLIEETLRPNPAYDGISEALYILRHTEPAYTRGGDGGWWRVLESACQAQASHLPGLFDLADPNAALRPSTVALLRAIQLVGGVSSSGLSNGADSGMAGEALDTVLADPDAIGWAYQFYQQEAKARVYAKLGSGGKVETRSEIAAATQLFTEPYMVKWLLQNSLGRSYHEAYPESRLPETWEYYIKPDKVTGWQGDKVKSEPITLSPPYRPKQSLGVTLSELTLLDPSMGSGHFLREGFDMLFAMVREQEPDLPAAEIAQRILRHHLFGIDIDPRAAQLAALTLVLRAWELMRGEPHSAFRIPPSAFQLNLATTPTLQPGSLDRHLTLHPEDEAFRPILQGVFAALEQAPLLGSLLRPEEHVEAGLAAFRKSNSGQFGLLGESAAANRLLEELGKHDPAELKRLLLQRIAHSFARESQASDVSAQLLGREASEGMHLLEILGRKYAVVATNPPYMGSGNANALLRNYLEIHYEPGKGDLYTAFMLRCIDLTYNYGRTAMITQQSWMFLSSYAELRAASIRRVHVEGNLAGNFTGVVRDTTIEAIAHLGRYAFSEIGNAAVSPVMYIGCKKHPEGEHFIWSARLKAPRPSEQQAEMLRSACDSNKPTAIVSYACQNDFLRINNSPIIYWAGSDIIKSLADNQKIGDVADIVEGLGTRWDERFLRLNSEVSHRDRDSTKRWFPFVKGGGYSKWIGLNLFYTDWQLDGARILNFREPSGRLRSRPQNIPYYFQHGMTYSAMFQGSLSVRLTNSQTIPGDAGPFILSSISTEVLLGILNSRYVSYILRLLSPTLQLKSGYLKLVPLPVEIPSEQVQRLVQSCTKYKTLQTALDFLELTFDPKIHAEFGNADSDMIIALLLSCEAILERLILNSYHPSHNTATQILEETGSPSGWFSSIKGYETLPKHSDVYFDPSISHDLYEWLTNHNSLALISTELIRIKNRLRILYEAGPGAASEALYLETIDGTTDEEESHTGAYIPIPPESFLEELSVKLQIHPISVYWLLEELRSEGVRCKPEEKRLLEDRLTVWVLRLLGHRWPKQIEAGEAVPSWADSDGIIPLVNHPSLNSMGEATLAERIRQRLRSEGGDLGTQQTEALLHELTGRTLDEWLRRDFFKRHISQFKKRPIAWHLASTPIQPQVGGSRKKLGKSEPVFECLVYYHACNSDILARIRTQYVEPLLAREERQLAHARQSTLPGVDVDETAAAIANARLHELRDFASRLRQVEESGFACPELESLVAAEPLDRWSGDGVLSPLSHDALLAQEQAWTVDINDGVRVNIAPLQQAGLLAHDVLNAKDLRKAIPDRARWRADERRWVRSGKLPRCGWQDESIPESPRWTELAPERESERARLEEKRQKVVQELQGEGD